MTGARVLSSRPHAPSVFAGEVELLEIESELLQGNPLGDPAVRTLSIYRPPGAGGAGAEPPLVVLLPGYSGNGATWLDPHRWWPGWIVQWDRAVARGERAPAALAVVDCFTALGGSQYVDSPAVGPYESHVVDELLPLLEERLPGARGRVAVAGKSSGGFGALRLAMRHEGRFAACASISGDCGFDQHCPIEFLKCLRGLVPHDGDPARFLAHFAEDRDLSGDAHSVIYTLAMAACYSPAPERPLGFELPFDLATGETIPAVWERWLAFDPLVAVAGHTRALRALRLLWIECGLADEFHLQWGARRLSRRLHALGVPHEHVEHPRGHRGIDARFLEVIDRLARALA